LSKAILVCLALSLGPIVTAAAGEAGTASHAVATAAIAKTADATAAADQACLGAVYQVASNYDEQRPLSGRAAAFVRRCNGDPNKIACEVASQTMVREYGKTPFTCGANTAEADPLILPWESAPLRW
jgi:hypothetical protein